MTRAVAMAAVVLGAAVLATPAAAHEEGWAGSGWMIDHDVRFAEQPRVGFFFVHDGPATQPGIEAVSLSVAVVTDTEVPPACVPPVPEEVLAEPESENPEELRAEVALVIPCNGRYTVTATARTGTNALHREAEQRSLPPLAFEAAVPPPPPSNVKAELTDLDGDAAARVTWSPPDFPPADLVGYRIARSRSADDDFELVGESVEPVFVDGEAAEGGVYHYRVESVRLGVSGDDLIASEATAPASVDVPAPPTSSTTAGTSVSRPAGDLSGFGTLQQQAARIRPAPAPAATVQPGPVTTVDGGFQPTLPFDPNVPGAPAATTTIPVGEPAGGLAGVASEILDDGGDPSDRKAVLAPVAGALALLVVFLQLRWLLRQAQP